MSNQISAKRFSKLDPQIFKAGVTPLRVAVRRKRKRV